jgi:pantoate--beta-alanine ligase
MAADLCIPIEIVGAPTVREADGLAMSSRNQYLTEAERKIAPAINQGLKRAVARVQGGETNFAAIENEELEALKKLGFRPDYFTVRDAKTLTSPEPAARHLVMLAAARLGKARLIDNLQIQR